MVISPLVIEIFGLRGIILYLNSSSKLQIKLVLSEKRTKQVASNILDAEMGPSVQYSSSFCSDSKPALSPAQRAARNLGIDTGASLGSLGVHG